MRSFSLGPQHLAAIWPIFGVKKAVLDICLYHRYINQRLPWPFMERSVVFINCKKWLIFCLNLVVFYGLNATAHMQQFEQRWRDASVLVIGSSYSAPEYRRWGAIDPNYIGIGSDDRNSEKADIVVENNPFDKALDRKPIWAQLEKMAKETKKKFDHIYFDYRVDKFNPGLMEAEMVKTIPELLVAEGLLHLPAERGTSLAVEYEAIIKLVPHDQSIVPQIEFKTSGVKDHLSERLRQKGVEILDVNDKTIKIYTKLYGSDEGPAEFHKGYSIKTFFESFPDLQKYIDRKSFDSYEGFYEDFKKYEEPRYYGNFTTMQFLYEEELPSPTGEGKVKYVVMAKKAK